MAVKTVDTALVQRLLNEISPDILRKLVQNHQTGSIVRRYGGVKKTLDILTFDNVKKLIRGFNKAGSAQGEEFEYGKVQLSVAKFMVILDVTASDDVEEAFISFLEGTGVIAQDLADDVYAIQFFTWLLNQSMMYMDAELEDADWLAIEVTSGANAAADAHMIHKFNGYRRQAATLANGGNGSVVTTGAIDATNAVTKIESFYQGFDKQIKRQGGYIFCSYQTFDNYKLHWRTLNSGRELGVEKLEGTDYEAIPLYLGGGKTYLVPVQGFGDDDALIGCLPEHMAMGYDILGNGFDIQKRGFTTYGYLELKYGVTLLMRKPGYLLVNDRLIAVEITTPRTNA